MKFTLRCSTDDGLFFVEAPCPECAPCIPGLMHKLKGDLLAKTRSSGLKSSISISVDALVHDASSPELLEHLCLQTLGKDEMSMHGARWRQRIKDDPQKLHSVLSELRLLQKEGRHVRNPGSYAE